MKIWRTKGSPALAVSPSELLSVGTVRQPSTVCPSCDHDLLELRLEGAAQVRVLGQEDHPHAILPQGGQRTAAFRSHAAEELVGHLHVDARAVARVGLTAAGAAVVEVDQHRHGLADDLVGLLRL